MIVLGVDPGAWLGWAALAVEGEAARYLDAGVLSVEELGEDGARDRLLVAADRLRPELVAVERVRRVLPTLGFQRGAAQQATRLVDASWLGGEIAAACRLAGRRVAMPQAEEVRRAFVEGVGPTKRGEKRPDMDAVLLALAEQRIALWPPHIRGEGAAYLKDGADLMSNRRSHAVDAAILALFAGTSSPPPARTLAAPRQLSLMRGGSSP